MGNYVLMTSPASGSDTAAGAAGTTSSDPTATAGTTGTMARPGSSYVLDGRDSELKNHVGHRIEVTGTVDKTMDHAVAPPATSTTTSGSASSRMSTAPTLKVSSIKMISSDCSAK
jgi:hypothetical protein